jgi:hypothetical protein
MPSFDGVGFQEVLDPLKRLAVQDWLVLARIPFAPMADVANVDLVLEEVRE